ncbi:GNAT family N-acetyltransferase [Mycolicibacterium aubagnense]|uniref:GNAT family N-acetyltransferase n=1 Tax=Mycolicibacterium aubagnense TaxID=319707 RepID=UPI0031343056
MDLELIDHRRGTTDGRSWAPPFDSAVAYQHPHWWNRQLGGESWFIQVLANGVEVARVEFDDPGGINPNYEDVPELGDERLEIQFIEVSTAARGRGVGTQVVRHLADRHRNRRLFAYREPDSVNYCSNTSNTSRSGRAVCPICVVLSSLFAPVLGHWRDTDGRVFGATRRHPVALGAGRGERTRPRWRRRSSSSANDDAALR